MEIEKWRNRIVRVGAESPDQLLANPRNWRIHSQLQQRTALAVLREIGIVQQVIVNERTGFMVDGHMRVALALSEGVESLPVTYVDLDEDEEALILATFDPIGAMAATDQEQLTELLDGIEIEDANVREMLDGLIEQDKSAAAVKAQPEVVLSPELLERQDYLVFVFDNELDWRAAVDELDVGTVFEHDPANVRKGAQSANTGIGRVLLGKQLLARLRGEQVSLYVA